MDVRLWLLTVFDIRSSLTRLGVLVASAVFVRVCFLLFSHLIFSYFIQSCLLFPHVISAVSLKLALGWIRVASSSPEYR